ncbi:hypothetical protein ACF0H5_015298 [Mactra antiquata]
MDVNTGDDYGNDEFGCAADGGVGDEDDGNTGITAEDMVCILSNGCNTTLRVDGCEFCDVPLENDINGTGSRYKDCNDECFTPDTLDLMAQEDECGECGGHGETCSPKVTDLDLMLIPITSTLNINITGLAFATPDLQIIQIERKTTATTLNKKVLGQFVIEKIYNSTRLEIRTGSLEVGKYEIGARTGNDGKEYVDPFGPMLTVYDETNVGVSSVSPDEQDIDGTTSVSVTVSLSSREGVKIKPLFEATDGFICIERDSDDTSMISSETPVSGTYDDVADTVTCDVTVPEVDSRKYVCVSFNGFHVVGCKYVTFFVLAPEPVENVLTFDEGDDTITLSEGLKTEGTFYRLSQPFELTVVNAESNTTDDGTGDSTLEIAPRGAWQSFFSAYAAETAIFEIQIVKSAGSRGAKSIVWNVDNVVSVNYTDLLYLNIVVPETEGNYTISVTAVDYMGGEDTLTHTFAKRDINLPDISFSPLGVQELGNGLFAIHPNSLFIINTNVRLVVVDGVGVRDDYIFKWRLNGEVFNEGELFFRSSEDDTTVEECDDIRTYSLGVALKTNIDDELVYGINFIIKCRDPVAVISGSRQINMDVEYGIYDVYGTSSYDPDGGELQYEWWCETLGSTGMEADKVYALKLRISVEKSNDNYTNTDMIYFHAKSGDNPVVRMVTIRTKFRRGNRIMIKAHVGDGIKSVKWRFVDGLSAYDWLDALNSSIGRQTNMGEYSWFTINPNVLSPGRQYRLEAEATSESGQRAVEHHNIYVYRVLAGCEVEARAMTELQESSLTLRNCLGDADALWSTVDCLYDPIRIQLSASYSFMTPIFPDDVTSVYFNCTVTDYLGHRLKVQTNVVSVNKASDSEIEQARSNLRQSGKNLDALNLIADMTAFRRIINDTDTSTEAVAIVQEIMSRNPDMSDMKRVMLSYSRIDVKSIRSSDLKILLRHIKAIATQLCQYNGNSASDLLLSEDIESILKTTAMLASSSVDFRKDYRSLMDKLLCIQMKRMKNEDIAVFTMDNGTKQTYLVNALDDLEAFGVYVDFPEEIRSKYRDTWKCGTGVLCHGVGVKIEEYNSESPDLAFNRKDKECSRYINVGLYNQHTGNGIKVIDLEDVINIKFNVEGCPRPQCWYYDTALDRFDQSGVFSDTDKDGTFYCQTKHLTSFTIRSAPKVYEGKNIPYIISVTVGSILLVISCIVLIKSFMATKRRANTIEDVKDPLPENEGMVENSPPPSYQMTVSREEWRKY